MSLLNLRSPDEKAVWDLELAYWSYCKAMDLDSYLALWHPDFIGWPGMFPAPAGKESICDWLTGPSQRGLTMSSYNLEPLANRVTDNVAVVHYRVKFSWIDQQGIETPAGMRITHTWIRAGGAWQIIAGMSAPLNAEGK